MGWVGTWVWAAAGQADTEGIEDHAARQVVVVRLVVDVSGSMTRFNGHDGRLTKSLEAVLVVLEALGAGNGRIDLSIQGHSGDDASIPLVEWDALPTHRGGRLAVLQTMVTHSAYCWPGDHTVAAIRAATAAAEDRAAALGDAAAGRPPLVLALSDANLRRYSPPPKDCWVGPMFLAHNPCPCSRYGIEPEDVSAALGGGPAGDEASAEAFLLLIGGLGDEAADVAGRVAGGRAVVCADTAELPALVGDFLRRAADGPD